MGGAGPQRSSVSVGKGGAVFHLKHSELETLDGAEVLDGSKWLKISHLKMA